MLQQLYTARQVTGDPAHLVLRSEDRKVANNNRWRNQFYKQPKMVVIERKNLRHKSADFRRVTRGWRSFARFGLINFGLGFLVVVGF